MGKSVFLRQPHGPVDTRHFTAAIPTITAQDQELPLQLHCITLAASSTKIKVQNSCHGIQVHSRLGSAPSYLASHCKPTSSCPGRSHLRSATSGQLNFRHTKIDYGKRSFDVNGSVVSNSLPTELRSPDISLDVFKAKLKTFLFNC